ncbi:MAG: hypothetical protein MAG715_00542 [Methanonatronarchaeales archaeon]|nr:hypothetical protein [Methanonatronarchaeales archaeon]
MASPTTSSPSVSPAKPCQSNVYLTTPHFRVRPCTSAVAEKFDTDISLPVPLLAFDTVR